MKRLGLLISLIMVVSMLAACAESEPEVVEKEVTRVIKETVVEKVVEKETVVETVVEKETVLQTVVEKETILETVVEEVVITATPEPTKGPTVGGSLVWAIDAEPDSLFSMKFVNLISAILTPFIGGSLVTIDPDGNYVPYLAESWEVSEDGLTWDFALKKGIKFHDGTPCTAHDYAWTFQTILDPETEATASATLLAAVASAEAVDDYTLRLTLKAPSFPLLYGLSDAGRLQPLPQAAVEEPGDQFGRQPVGVGPYKFKEWRTGEKIVLERNPDYAWGPDFVHQGPAFIETIEFLIIPEYATTMAGMEAGEIDYRWPSVEAKDVQRLKDTGMFEIFEGLHQGSTGVFMNTSAPPFDDIRVRQAFNLAVDQQTLIKVAELGNAVELKGPISQSVVGYWPGVEEIGYSFDLERAKALMEEAGYIYNADGMLEKDGEPLKLVLRIKPPDPWVKRAELLKEQWKALGAEIEIMALEDGVFYGDLQAGVHTLAMSIAVYGEADLMYLLFHGDSFLNFFGRIDDPELDEILTKTRTTVDPAERQEWVNQAQKRIVEQAYFIPLYTPKVFVVLNNRVKDPLFMPQRNNIFSFNDAYIAGD